jgi:hypothetical protein
MKRNRFPIVIPCALVLVAVSRIEETSGAAKIGSVYDGPVVQTQDLTVFNVTKEAVIARQAKVVDELPPIPGVQRVEYTPVEQKPPAWWAEALIPVD